MACVTPELGWQGATVSSPSRVAHVRLKMVVIGKGPLSDDEVAVLDSVLRVAREEKMIQGNNLIARILINFSREK